MPLVVIEGLDGCGKGTQVNMLKESIPNIYPSLEFETVSFPRYGSSSSDMVKHFLSGEYGKAPLNINSHTAASFYSVDRAISYQTENWGKVYDNGGLVIADRYTTANVIYQGTNFIEEEYNESIETLYYKDNDRALEGMINFMDDIYHNEYNILKIPSPDLVIFLTLDDKTNDELLEKRRAEEGEKVAGDIIEAEGMRRYRIGLDVLLNCVEKYTYKRLVRWDHNYLYYHFNDGPIYVTIKVGTLGIMNPPEVIQNAILCYIDQTFNKREIGS
jgi:dTMP kinase